MDSDTFQSPLNLDSDTFQSPLNLDSDTFQSPLNLYSDTFQFRHVEQAITYRIAGLMVLDGFAEWRGGDIPHQRVGLEVGLSQEAEALVILAVVLVRLVPRHSHEKTLAFQGETNLLKRETVEGNR